MGRPPQPKEGNDEQWAPNAGQRETKELGLLVGVSSDPLLSVSIEHIGADDGDDGAGKHHDK